MTNVWQGGSLGLRIPGLLDNRAVALGQTIYTVVKSQGHTDCKYMDGNLSLWGAL